MTEEQVISENFLKRLTVYKGGEEVWPKEMINELADIIKRYGDNRIQTIQNSVIRSGEDEPLM